MILKKPYALLIKNFRLIHIILTFLAAYILNRTGTIYTFFTNYINNGYNVVLTSDFTKNLIPTTYFFAVLLTIGILITLLVLLKYKKKKSTQYDLFTFYYILLIIFIVIYYGIINTIANGIIEAEMARIYRDISLLVYLPQFLIVLMFSIRALGFNVKQFNFKSDYDALELRASDNEEVELNIEFDTSKATRNFHKFIREMKYYIKENLLYFSIIMGVLVFTVSYSVISNLSFFTNTQHKVGETFVHKGVSVVVDNAQITNINLGGDVILEDKYFIVLTVTLENVTNDDVTISTNDYKIEIGGEMINPSVEYSSSFSDYGYSLVLPTVKYSSKKTYVLPYIIDKDDISNSVSLKVYSGTYVSNNVTYPTYNVINLKPELLTNNIKVDTLQLGETIDFTNSIIGSSLVKFTQYKIDNVHYYEKEKTINNEVIKYTDSVYVDYTGTYKNKTILAVSGSVTIDESTLYYSNNKSIESLFNNFVKVSYEIDETTYEETITYIKKADLSDTHYIYVPQNVKNATSISLIFHIRNKDYTYILK